MSEVTFAPFQKVLVRDNDLQEWRASFYSHKKGRGHRCVNDWYLQCIPYNEETVHLLGTTNSPTPPELEFTFGDKVEVRDGDSQEWRKAIFLKMHMPYYFCLLDSEATSCWKQCRHADW